MVENEVKTPIIKCVQYSRVPVRPYASTNPKNLERQFTGKLNTKLSEYCVGGKVKNPKYGFYNLPYGFIWFDF